MFIVLPEHLPQELCSELIDIYEHNENISEEWRRTQPLDLRKIPNQEELTKCKFVTRYVNNTAVRFFGIETYVEVSQIVKWPVGSMQPVHRDMARETTTFTSITYLNDDFEGGETYFTDEDLLIKPKVGRTILFDGKRFEHGVRKITNGTRYTLALWYSNNVMECEV